MRSAALWIAIAFAMHLPTFPVAILGPGAAIYLWGFVGPSWLFASFVLCSLAAWFFLLSYILLGIRWFSPLASEGLLAWAAAYAFAGTTAAGSTAMALLLSCAVEEVRPSLRALVFIPWVGAGVLLSLGVRRLRSRITGRRITGSRIAGSRISGRRIAGSRATTRPRRLR